MNPKTLLKSLCVALALVLVPRAPAEPASPLAPIVARWRAALAELRGINGSFERTLGHAAHTRRVFVALNQRREAEEDLNPPIPRHWFRIVGRPYRTVKLTPVVD